MTREHSGQCIIRALQIISNLDDLDFVDDSNPCKGAMPEILKWQFRSINFFGAVCGGGAEGLHGHEVD